MRHFLGAVLACVMTLTPAVADEVVLETPYRIVDADGVLISEHDEVHVAIVEALNYSRTNSGETVHIEGLSYRVTAIAPPEPEPEPEPEPDPIPTDPVPAAIESVVADGLNFVVSWTEATPVPDGGYDVWVDGQDNETWRTAALMQTVTGLAAGQHCFIVETRYSSTDHPESAEVCATSEEPSAPTEPPPPSTTADWRTNFTAGPLVGDDALDLGGDVARLMALTPAFKGWLVQDNIPGEIFDVIDSPVAGASDGRVMHLELDPALARRMNLKLQQDRTHADAIGEFHSRRRIYLDPQYALMQDGPWRVHMFEEYKVRAGSTGRMRIRAYWTRPTADGLGWWFQAVTNSDPDAGIDATTWWDFRPTEVRMPIGQWVTLDTYFKIGDDATGRYRLTMTPDGGEPVTIVDVHDWTDWPDAADGLVTGPQDWFPFITYVAGQGQNHMVGKGGTFRQFVDWWEIDVH